MIGMVRNTYRETIAGHSKVCEGTILPLLGQVLAFSVLETHVLHATGDRVEAGSEGDNVEFSELAVAGNDTSLCELGDGSLLDVDNIVLSLVHHLVEVLFQRGTLSSPCVRSLERSKNITLARIRNTSSSLLDPEVVGLIVGLGVGKQIVVGSEPESETALLPH
jgi:hypothetical protein